MIKGPQLTKTRCPHCDIIRSPGAITLHIKRKHGLKLAERENSNVRI